MIWRKVESWWWEQCSGSRSFHLVRWTRQCHTNLGSELLGLNLEQRGGTTHRNGTLHPTGPHCSLQLASTQPRPTLPKTHYHLYAKHSASLLTGSLEDKGPHTDPSPLWTGLGWQPCAAARSPGRQGSRDGELPCRQLLFPRSLRVPRALSFIPSLNELCHLTRFNMALERTQTLI